jgi:sugar (pentulose or hexulose) kinase
LNSEPHVRDISILTTLAGYVHWKLTGQKGFGVGEASGMFTINSMTKDLTVDGYGPKARLS